MPDGDLIHNKIPHLYKKPYQYLCEGKATDADCSWALQDALRKELKKGGDAPVEAALRVGAAITEASITPLGFKAAEVNIQVDRVLQYISIPSREKELIRGAARDLVQCLRYGSSDNVGEAEVEVCRRYFLGKLDAAFTERIPQIPSHHMDADPVELQRRVRTCRPDLEKAAVAFAKQACKTGSVKGLRRPSRAHVKAVSLDEDLL